MTTPESPTPSNRRAVLRTVLVLVVIALGFYGWSIVKIVQTAGAAP